MTEVDYENGSCYDERDEYPCPECQGTGRVVALDFEAIHELHARLYCYSGKYSIDSVLQEAARLGQQIERERCAEAWRRVNMTPEEIIRIRNLGAEDKHPKVWNRQLMLLCDAALFLRDAIIRSEP